LLGRYPRQLSGGQRQRVAMGRAIVRQPEVFLFDEPLSNLDAQLRIEMRSEIKRLHRSLGATVIFVTHDQVEAMTMADTVVVLRDGRIEQIGNPLDLYDDPANAFVATFLGAPAMNLIAGRLVPGEGSVPLFLREPSLRLTLSGRTAAGVGPGGVDCRIGIRPEHVEVRRGDEAAPGPAALGGRIVLAEATGADTFLTLSTGVGEIVAMVRGRTDLRPGQEVVAVPDPARLVVFDAADGRRIA
jgi:multiple sugar transport system ATP-binding protein